MSMVVPVVLFLDCASDCPSYVHIINTAQYFPNLNDARSRDILGAGVLSKAVDLSVSSECKAWRGIISHTTSLVNGWLVHSEPYHSLGVGDRPSVVHGTDTLA
jgi:hypothetical protein